MVVATVLTVLVLALAGACMGIDRPGDGRELPGATSAPPTPTPSATTPEPTPTSPATPEPAEPARWADGEVHGRWTVRYTGYGEVVGTDEEVVLQPRSADAANLTHGALVHTTRECQDASFALTVHTESQVRAGTPNPWEVGWVLWNFRDDLHFYAATLKPNGWEITKQDPDYPGSQRFVASGTEPQFPIGTDYRVAVTQDWPRMTVTVDGQELATVVDEETPYRGGAVGLYTEDARVRFHDFDLPDCLVP